MEARTTPAIQVIRDRPPLEPPPSLENKIQINEDQEEVQWIEDTTTSAKSMLDTINIHNTTNLCREQYTPCINKLTTNKNMNDLHLRNKIEEYSARLTRSSTYPLPSPVPHPIHIPKPKSSMNDHSALLYGNEATPKTWHIPIDDIVDKSKIISPQVPGNTESTDEMLHKTTSVINITHAKQQSLKHNTSFKICTDLVQNDTGAN